MIQHVAVIPDGNRRWAKQHGLATSQGHHKGADRFQEISETVFGAGVEYFTFWAASIDNLTKRSEAEISVLIQLLKGQLRKEVQDQNYQKNGIRFQVIGHWQEFILDEEVHQLIGQLHKETAQFTKHVLTVLLGYDGKREMLEAIASLADRQEIISEVNLLSRLGTGSLPAVDLVIRTGGEPHWSAGFMMWQTANSQFYFTETLWPDFDTEECKAAIASYTSRERRLGK